MRLVAKDGRRVAVDVHAGADDFTRSLPGPRFDAVPLIRRGRSYLDNAAWTDYDVVYRSNPWLWAVINLVARSSSRTPITVTRPHPDHADLREPVAPGTGSNPARLARALRKPADGRSWQAQQYGTTVDRLVRGNALWEIEGGLNGLSIDGFRRIPWKYIRGGEVAGEMVYLDHSRDPDGILDPRKLMSDQVVHFGFWHDSNDPINTSAVSTLHSTLALFDAVYRHLVNYFANSTRPGGHYEIDPKTPETAVKRMMAIIRAAHAGPDNAGRPTMTSGKYHPNMATPNDAKVVELAKASREEIVAAFGVAPPLVGILDRAIMSNVKELREHTVRDTTGPHLELMAGDIEAQAVNTRPRLEREGIEIDLDFMRQLRPTPEAESAMLPNELRIKTPNEKRAERGLAPIEGDDRADQLWFPNGGADPADAEEPTEPTDDPVEE